MFISSVAAGFIAAMPPLPRIEPVLSITRTSSMPRSSRWITVRADTSKSGIPATLMKCVGRVAVAWMMMRLLTSSKVTIGWPGSSSEPM